MATSTVIQSNESAIPAEQKYVLEAAKRMREEGTKQFEQLHFSDNDRLRSLADDVWADHAALDALPLPVDEGGSVKFLIQGAGMGGIVMAIKLIKKGFSADQMLLVDIAGGVGGTWYWNRYPVGGCVDICCTVANDSRDFTAM
jgi:ssRNA-specific RNase YbeY (16S rRNA maturation enzyme)